MNTTYGLPDSVRGKALLWWRNMTNEQRKDVVEKSNQPHWVKEIELLGADSLTGRMIEELYQFK